LASARLRLSTLPEEPRLRAAWLERALDSLEEAQARNPGSDALPIWRALAFAVLGDVGGTPDLTPQACSRLVLELADEALAREPRAPVARVLRAKALLDLGREAEGEAELQQVGSVVVHGDQEAQIELLNTTSWMIVRTAGGEAVAIRRAVNSARLATAVVPGNGFWLNTLGIALYRSGNYEEAMGVLERSDALNATVIAGGHPADSAFLAMAAHQLGRSERARTQLERLRVQAGGPGFSEDPEVAGFMREALALLSGDQ
jgi:tetratricopeptide (TPR) repeat protein